MKRDENNALPYKQYATTCSDETYDFKQDILDQDQPMPNDDKNFDYI